MAETRGDHAVKNNLAVTGNAKFSGGVDIPYVEVIDQKSDNAGQFDPGAWKVRDLTFTVFNDFATSITVTATAGDEIAEIVVPAGTYYCEISCPAYDVDQHVARLADATDAAGDSATTLVLGTSEDSNAAHATQTRSFVTGKFTVSRSTTLEVQHQCTTQQTTNGFGVDNGFAGVNSVYTIVKIWQVKQG
jgi:hypothetical protein